MKYQEKMPVLQILLIKYSVILVSCLCITILFFRCIGEKWYSVNVDEYSMENSLIRIKYGSPPAGYWGNGIIEFLYKPTSENFGYTLDTYGCGYAMYDRTGPVAYELVKENPNMVEVKVTFTDSVYVVKRERIYKNLPILEIEYEKLSIWWWEDFFHNPDDSVVVSVYGIPQDITREKHAVYKKAAEEKKAESKKDETKPESKKAVEKKAESKKEAAKDDKPKPEIKKDNKEKAEKSGK